MIIDSILGGGLIGLVGPMINRGFQYFENKQKHKQALELAEIKRESDAANHAHEIKLHEMNQKARAAETEREKQIIYANMDATNQEGSWGGLDVSTQGNNEVTMKASQWVVNCQAMTRPVITLISVLIALIIFVIDKTHRAELTDAIITITIAAVLWWFGDRKHYPKRGAT